MVCDDEPKLITDSYDLKTCKNNDPNGIPYNKDHPLCEPAKELLDENGEPFKAKIVQMTGFRRKYIKDQYEFNFYFVGFSANVTYNDALNTTKILHFGCTDA